MFVTTNDVLRLGSAEKSWVVKTRPKLKRYFRSRDYGWTDTIVILWTHRRLVLKKRAVHEGIGLVLRVQIPRGLGALSAHELHDVLSQVTVKAAEAEFAFIEPNGFDVDAFMSDLKAFFEEAKVPQERRRPEKSRP